jgi:hypothetical protein
MGCRWALTLRRCGWVGYRLKLNKAINIRTGSVCSVPLKDSQERRLPFFERTQEHGHGIRIVPSPGFCGDGTVVIATTNRYQF